MKWISLQMSERMDGRALVVAIAVAAGAPVASGQCDWDAAVGAPGARISEGLFEPEVNALLDGGGPLAPGVFVGGLFAELGGAEALSESVRRGRAGGGLRRLGGTGLL